MTIGDDVEEVANRLLHDARIGRAGPICVVSLVTRLVGERSLRFAPDCALPGNGALVRVGSEWRIYIRKNAPDHLKRFVALHELAHWALGGDATEESCNRLAGALLLPQPAFLGAVEGRRRMSGVARVFGSDETCAWLRLGELTATPLALVTPRKVRVRGPEHAWPTEARIRQLVEGKAVPGLKKTRLGDDRARVVLRAC